MKSFICAIMCLTTCFALNQVQAQEKSKNVTGWSYNDNNLGNFHVKKIKKPKIPEGFVFVHGGSFIYHKNHNIVAKKEDTSLLMNNVTKRYTIPSFFMMQTEVTNQEYRAFTDWVRDSIGLSLLAEKYPDQDFRKKNGALYWKKRKSVKDSLTTCLEADMCYNINNSFSGKTQLDNSKLKYRFTYKSKSNNKEDEVQNSIAVYPDTTSWNELPYSYNSNLVRSYFTHPAYNHYPVVGVSYYQALAYADWKTKMEENPGLSYRLPTEVEWEYAAYQPMDIGGIYTSYDYPWKSGWVTDKDGHHFANFGIMTDEHGYQQKGLNENLSKKKRRKDFSYMNVYTTPAKYFPSNAHGLFDMAGNVAEWVADYAAVEQQPFYKEVDELPAGVVESENDKKLNFSTHNGYQYFSGSKKIKKDNKGIVIRDSLGRIATTDIDSTEKKDKSRVNLVYFHYKKYNRVFIKGPIYDINANIIEVTEGKWIITERQIADSLPYGIRQMAYDDGIIDIADTVYYVNKYRLPGDNMNEYYDNLNKLKMHNIEVLLTADEPRIVKGGSWYNPAVYMLTSSRQAVSAQKQSPCVGFRLAKTYIGPEPWTNSKNKFARKKKRSAKKKEN
jgi:sulfatase modifying factor 1